MSFQMFSTTILIKLLITFSVVGSFKYFILLFDFTLKQIFAVYLYLFFFTLILGFLLKFNKELEWALMNIGAVVVSSLYFSRKFKDDDINIPIKNEE